MRGTLLALGEASADDDERILAVSRMMYETPPLRARSIEKHLRWYDDLNYFDAALDAIRRPSVDAG